MYHHVVASTIKGNISAWRIEQKRLARKRQGLFSWHNAVIRGHLMSVLLVAIAAAMGGWQAALFFTACGLWGKSLLEIVNYMEHYGMVRNPATPVQPRHSWNTNKRISSWAMFNLTRHSHHHAQGEVPYQDLKPFPDAPMMINGYLTTIIVAMIPPLAQVDDAQGVGLGSRLRHRRRAYAGRANQRPQRHCRNAGPGAGRCASQRGTLSPTLAADPLVGALAPDAPIMPIPPRCFM